MIAALSEIRRPISKRDRRLQAEDGAERAESVVVGVEGCGRSHGSQRGILHEGKEWSVSNDDGG